jgi:hypothetical protein
MKEYKKNKRKVCCYMRSSDDGRNNSARGEMKA